MGSDSFIMQLICESSNINDYLSEHEEVDFSHPLIQGEAKRLFDFSQTEIEKARIAFEFVRDNIFHSWDIQDRLVTCKASDVLKHKKGICYAKSNLLAALLRSQGIPTGFCYQRLMIFDTPDKGYSIHALNAVFLKEINRWIRLDARGNKPGVRAEFSTVEEKLAFSPDPEKDERDYPIIYSEPHSDTISVLKKHLDALDLYQNHLPAKIDLSK